MRLTIRVDGHGGGDSGTALGFRLNRECSLHELKPFFHAGKTESTSLLRYFGVEANSGIAHDEM